MSIVSLLNVPRVVSYGCERVCVCVCLDVSVHLILLIDKCVVRRCLDRAQSIRADMNICLVLVICCDIRPERHS